MTTLAQKRVPSLRTRQPSPSNRALGGGRRQRPLRQSRLPVLLGVEAGEMLADDLRRLHSP